MPGTDVRIASLLDASPADQSATSNEIRSIVLTFSPSISPLRPFRLSSSTNAIASSILLSAHSLSKRNVMGVGAKLWTAFRPMMRVSATVVENGPRAVGAVAWRRDEPRVGVIGCRLNGGRGEVGGVRPEPDGGSSGIGDVSSGGDGKSIRTETFVPSVSIPSPLDGGFEADRSPLRSSIRANCIRSSRIVFLTEIPYGE